MPFEGNEAFTLILEPVKRCNLRCRYCYADCTGTGMMSPQTLQAALAKAVDYGQRQGFREIHLLWHGGEPLLAGLSFFQEAMEILAGLAADLSFQHFLQTNGLLLDNDFCAFFRDHEFQIGVSLDGPQALHDSMRVDADGQGSHRAVVDKVHLLEAQGVAAGFNAVVTRLSLGQEEAIYRHFQRLGYGFRVNPVVPGLDPEAAATWLLRPGEYGAFLGRLFDAWVSASGPRVRVSPLDLYLKALMGDGLYECQQQGTCVGSCLGVKPSGDAVLCSRFETPLLGNILEQEIQELLSAPICDAVRRRAETLSDCHACRFWSICHGGCPLNAWVFSHDYLAKDPFCPDYQLIFARMARALAELPLRPQAHPEL